MDRLWRKTDKFKRPRQQNMQLQSKQRIFREQKRTKKIILSVLRDTKEDRVCNITKCYKEVTRRKQQRDLEVKYTNPEIKISIGALDDSIDIIRD